jgi:hypothetical protein
VDPENSYGDWRGGVPGRCDVPFDDQPSVGPGRYGYDSRSDAPDVCAHELNNRHASRSEVPEDLPVELEEVYRTYHLLDRCTG